MIYVTGDTHGDFTRFNTKKFPVQKQMTKNDFVIICGDFGGVWDNSMKENYWLDWLNDKPFTTLFVSGNHENFDLLGEIPVSEWKGGKVQLVRDSIIHLMRGQIYDIDGKLCFTMGGASSHDIEGGILELDDPYYKLKQKRLKRQKLSYRTNHVSWWKEELPSDEEYRTARDHLAAYGWKVDYIFTHCCPSSVQDLLVEEEKQQDRLTDFFDELKNSCTFDYWFCGHYHVNQVLMEKYIVLYEKILQTDNIDIC